MTTDDLAFDQRHIWHPYTSMTSPLPVYPVASAEGCELILSDGSRLVDGMSSWWAAIHGYNHPELNQAMIDQVGRFSHVMLGGLTHEPVQRLAGRLEEFLPGDLNYSFFSDSGSVAVEVALKMALQYYMNRGETERTLTLALEHAYHGDTFKTMETGDDEDYHFVLKAYGPSRHVIHIPTEIPALEQAFEQYHSRLNCLIVEPLLQGAGGMRMYSLSFLKRARQLCDQYGVLLISDEVATGFGRTGNRFVSDLVLPDILVLGKALTGGYIGHAATVANEKVFRGFFDDQPEHALMHGPTFMGNALACSAALKSIELFETQDYMAKIRRIEAITRRELDGFSDDRIREIRIMGGCVCIEVKDASILEGYQKFARERGVFSRPFLNYLYAMVPYVIAEEELVQVIQVMKEWFRR